MNSKNIKKWIRIIALWTFIMTIVGAAFYILIQLKVIDEQLSLREHVELIIYTIVGLVIFVGLWRLSPWGCKFAIIFTLVSWPYALVDLFIDYERFTGLFMSPFIIIEALILRYLLTDDVQNFFNITSRYFKRLLWTPAALLLLALFFVVLDFFDGLVALVTVVAILLGLTVSRRFKRDLKLKRI